MQVISYYQRNKNRIRNLLRITKLTTKDNTVHTRLRKRPHPGECELCGLAYNHEGKSIRLEYHHWIATYPEIGLWLCHKCHTAAEFLDLSECPYLANRYYDLKETVKRDFCRER